MKGCPTSYEGLINEEEVECPNCGELKRPHHVCASCGYYSEKEVILTAEEIDIDEDAA